MARCESYADNPVSILHEIVRVWQRGSTMRKPWTIIARVPVLAILMGALLGCGNSVPDRQASAANSEAKRTAAQRYAGSSTEFAEVSPQDLSQALRIGSCNVDLVNGQRAFLGVPLDHTGMAILDGWAADGSGTNAVPRVVRVVLTGATGDFAVSARTGITRADVVSGTGDPAYANSGFKVKADMDGVPVGDYGVGILMQDAGVSRYCTTKARVSVQ